MISTLSVQQEIQKQHAALLAPSTTVSTATSKSMTDTSPKHSAATDEDFPHSSPKRRKTTHDVPEPKQDVWEFYADSEVDSDYGTPKRTKKSTKTKDSTSQPKKTRARTAPMAPALVFDDVLGGPVAPPITLDDENDEDFVPEGAAAKKKARKKSEASGQKEKRPARGKTTMKEPETVDLLSSDDGPTTIEQQPERHSSPQAPASSFQVAVPNNAMATQEREQYQVYPPTAIEDPTQEQPSTLVFPPYEEANFRLDSPATIPTVPNSEACATTVPDSSNYQNAPVVPQMPELGSESNAPRSSESFGYPKSFIGNSDFDPTPPNQPKMPIEKIVDPEPIKTLELVREIAKEEFGLRRKPSITISSIVPTVENDELEQAKSSPKKGKERVTKRKKIKLQARPKTVGDVFDFTFDDDDDEDDVVSMPKPKPRKKKGLLALNDDEDEDWAGEGSAKSRKKATEKKPPAEKKTRGRPRKKPKPLIEEEEEQPNPTTSDPLPTEPQTSSVVEAQKPSMIADSDEDSPLSEIGSDFGDDDRIGDSLPKSKPAANNALSERINMSSPPRQPAQPDVEVSKAEPKKDTRKSKKATTQRKKAVSPPPLQPTPPEATEVPLPETLAPPQKSGAKIKLRRAPSRKKAAQREIVDSEDDEGDKVEAEPVSSEKASSPPPPVTPAKPQPKVEDRSVPIPPVTPANQTIPSNEDKSGASTIKRESARSSVTPGTEGRLSWQQARYRVGLSKRQRIEPLHGYLKKEH
ncbi:hypothetical protein BJ508DRAFT_1767 [Ascobolus immersus RN42]|uniref:Uncharacterized protein n=1 Tax=Ascobolus immersus RN42 TaxID=1160509 RepID=A0A3N4IUT9_ASCIM|nr:hypothetical protein BJ508DRAFT_1767 [Ascobolus immersus RN42]